MQGNGEDRTIRIARTSNQDDSESRDIEEVTFEFAVAVVRLTEHLPSQTPRLLMDRIVGLGTELGADVAEAFASHSKRTYQSRLESARRISRELTYWLRLVLATGLASQELMRPFLDETHAIHTTLTALCSRARTETETE